MRSYVSNLRYIYNWFKLENTHDKIYRAGKDEQYFYFVNHENNTYTHDRTYKQKYDIIKQLFEEKLRGNFDQRIIKSALFDAEDLVKDKNDFYTQSMISVLLDDYRPHDRD